MADYLARERNNERLKTAIIQAGGLKMNGKVYAFPPVVRSPLSLVKNRELVPLYDKSLMVFRRDSIQNAAWAASTKYTTICVVDEMSISSFAETSNLSIGRKDRGTLAMYHDVTIFFNGEFLPPRQVDVMYLANSSALLKDDVFGDIFERISPYHITIMDGSFVPSIQQTIRDYAGVVGVAVFCRKNVDEVIIAEPQLEDE